MKPGSWLLAFKDPGKTDPVRERPEFFWGSGDSDLMIDIGNPDTWGLFNRPEVTKDHLELIVSRI